jgi:hypothetical protein
MKKDFKKIISTVTLIDQSDVIALPKIHAVYISGKIVNKKRYKTYLNSFGPLKVFGCMKNSLWSSGSSGYELQR